MLGRGYREIRQHFPRPGWVEHDPEEIWASVARDRRGGARAARVSRPTGLAAIGITNQRETTVVWDERTGRPVHPAIVWQDRRTAERCRELPADLDPRRTGLVPDPYFSATKLEWILERVRASRERSSHSGRSTRWLVWKLTGGRAHVTDRNERLADDASRPRDASTWDDELLELFGVDRALLPEVVPSAAWSARLDLLGAHGTDRRHRRRPAGGPLRAGAASAGRGEGDLRDRLLRPRRMLGEAPEPPPDGLLQRPRRSRPRAAAFALEGAVLAAGAAIQWLRDGLGSSSRCRGERGSREQRRLDRRRRLRPRADRARLAALGSGRARADLRDHARNDARASCPRGARGDRASRSRTSLDVLPPTLACCGPTAERPQPLPDAVPGRPARVPGRGRCGRDTTALGAAALAGLAVGTWPSRGRCGNVRRGEGTSRR